MLVYVDLEHEQLNEIDSQLWQRSRMELLRNKYRFERLSRRSCLIMRYDSVTPERLAAVAAEAVLVSGHSLDLSYYAPETLAGLTAVYQAWTRPLLGFCGGFQLMAQAYGAPIGPMDTIPDGVTNLHLAVIQNVAGIDQELGFQPVSVRHDHPLFQGLEATPSFYQAHYWEVKQAPAAFDILAHSDHCRIQMLAHQTRPLFGTQFHPEAYDDRFGDGRQFLQNFFQLVNRYTDRTNETAASD